MTETWRSVGRFEVSDLGRVRRADNQRVLSQNRLPNGYRAVRAGRSGATVLVHRLVAAAFVEGQAINRNEVNHIDGVRDNNVPANLEWVNHAENIRHAHRMPSRKPHAARRAVFVDGVRYEAQGDAARAIGVTHGSVASAALRGHRCKGHEVRYA